MHEEISILQAPLAPRSSNISNFVSSMPIIATFDDIVARFTARAIPLSREVAVKVIANALQSSIAAA
jgi:hypothetical protein